MFLDLRIWPQKDNHDPISCLNPKVFDSILLLWFPPHQIKHKKRSAKCKTCTVQENKQFFPSELNVVAVGSVRLFFPPPFKTCSGELTLAKDIVTNTIWHGELHHGGKLMKWIENAKGIVYVLNKRKLKKKKKHNSPLVISTASWSMATSCLLNLKLHCRWF